MANEIRHAVSSYDVFISYSKPDADWVKKWLLPRLEAASLQCVDHCAFIVGAPRLEEVERLVLSSRKIILVFTPDYLKSEWTMFENLLVRTLDPDAKKRQVIPLLLRPCALPLHTGWLVHVDCTREENWGKELTRLVAAIIRDEPLSPSEGGPCIPYYVATSVPEAEIEARFNIPEGGFARITDPKEAECIVFDLSRPPDDWLKYLGGDTPLFTTTIFVALEGLSELSGKNIMDVIARAYKNDYPTSRLTICHDQNSLLDELKHIRWGVRERLQRSTAGLVVAVAKQRR